MTIENHRNIYCGFVCWVYFSSLWVYLVSQGLWIWHCIDHNHWSELSTNWPKPDVIPLMELTGLPVDFTSLVFPKRAALVLKRKSTIKYHHLYSDTKNTQCVVYLTWSCSDSWTCNFPDCRWQWVDMWSGFCWKRKQCCDHIKTSKCCSLDVKGFSWDERALG